jgi:tRNA (guanine37-N1)-methyltransferase
MRIDILTLFPETVDAFLQESMIGRGRRDGLLDIRCHNIRDWCTDRYRRTDDYPYGGGQGMIMLCEPLARCLEDIKEGEQVHTLLMSPRGKTFNQQKAVELLERDRFVIVCGHYEGIDQRFIDECIDEEISLGDFVLTGGEIAAITVADAVGRMVPGVLAESASFEDESHFNGLLEYPQYTRPEVWRDKKVPDVLLSGHHENIRKWRRKQSLEITRKLRPDMFEKLELSKEDKKLLEV